MKTINVIVALFCLIGMTVDVNKDGPLFWIFLAIFVINLIAVIVPKRSREGIDDL